jgi:hypothetical protein
VCLWRNFSGTFSSDSKPKLRTRDVGRFLAAIDGLKSDPELRVRYFEDSTATITLEYYDPEKVWPSGFTPSLHYMESRADRVIRASSGGVVIPTCDYTADKTDAARHVPGLKKGVIVLPNNLADLSSWYGDFCDSRGRALRAKPGRC